MSILFLLYLSDLYELKCSESFSWILKLSFKKNHFIHYWWDCFNESIMWMKVMEHKGVQYVRSHVHTLTAAHDLFELSPVCARVVLSSRNVKALIAIRPEKRGAAQLGECAGTVWVVDLSGDHTCHTFFSHRARFTKAKPNQLFSHVCRWCLWC